MLDLELAAVVLCPAVGGVLSACILFLLLVGCYCIYAFLLLLGIFSADLKSKSLSKADEVLGHKFYYY